MKLSTLAFALASTLSASLLALPAAHAGTPLVSLGQAGTAGQPDDLARRCCGDGDRCPPEERRKCCDDDDRCHGGD